jgi:hypothetical protein
MTALRRGRPKLYLRKPRRPGGITRWVILDRTRGWHSELATGSEQTRAGWNLIAGAAVVTAIGIALVIMVGVSP